MRALLRRLPLAVTDPMSLGLGLRVDEVGADYAENARLKAEAFAAASGLFTLADDTGLEVSALGGAPGLRSARLLEPGATDADRRTRLLSLLQGHPRPWTARFRCAMALCGPDGLTDIASGECAGWIIPVARGDHGFGYDPIFVVAGTGRTMAEFPMEEKNHLSHRARALVMLVPALRRRLRLPG